MQPMESMEKMNLFDNIYPSDLPFISKESEMRAALHFSEDEIVKCQKLNLLKTMLKKEKVPYLDEDVFLLAFLRAGNSDVERALNSLKAFYRAKSQNKDILGDVQPKDVIRTLSETQMGFLPYRDEEGCCLLYIHFEHWDPIRHNEIQMLSAVSCAILHTLQSPPTQTAGIKIILNVKGVTYSRIKHIRLKYLKLFITGVKSAIPVRIRAIYVINESVAITYFWPIVRPLLTKKLRNIHHFLGKDMKRLHKYISPKLLPKDLDGDLPSYDNTEWLEQATQSGDYLQRIFKV